MISRRSTTECYGAVVCRRDVLRGAISATSESPDGAVQVIFYPVGGKLIYVKGVIQDSLEWCCSLNSLLLARRRCRTQRRCASSFALPVQVLNMKQTIRLLPIIVALLLSFASDARYSLDDIRETLPGYCALLLHTLSASTLEHLQTTLSTQLGSKYASAYSTVGASIIGLSVYSMRELTVRPDLHKSRKSFAESRYTFR